MLEVVERVNHREAGMILGVDGILAEDEPNKSNENSVHDLFDGWIVVFCDFSVY